MFRVLFSLLAALSFSAAASAQLPEPLGAALSNRPEDITPERVALRMTVNRQSILVEIRPDETEDSQRYTLLQPASADNLTEEQVEMWAGFGGGASAEAEDSPDSAPGESYSVGAFDADSLRRAIGGSAQLEREAGPLLIYSFQPQSLPGQGGQAGERQALLDNLAGEIEIDAERNQVAAVRFALTDSFKPHLAARLREFTLEQRFVHEPVLGGPRFSGLTMSMAGSAVFQPFSQTMEIELVSVRYPGAVALEAGAESP